jgi:DNA-binding XRE family transcriptional regulator
MRRLLVAFVRQNDYSVLITAQDNHVKRKCAQGNQMNAVQCKMARAATGLGVRELASLADVSPATITRFERGEELMPRTVQAIRTALEAAGVEFINGTGVKLRA